MARFRIDNLTNYYSSLFVVGKHDATTWILAKDVSFTRIIDKLEKSKDALYEWITPLPKLQEDKSGTGDEYYVNLEEAYLRVIIHSGDSESPPITIGPFKQGLQDILITKGDETLEKTDSIKLGWIQE